MSRQLVVGWLGLVLALASACNVNPYDLGASGRGDARGTGTGDGGGGDGDGGAADDGGGRDGDTLPVDGGNCIPTPEVCNTRDDDCNGTVDDGFNLAADPSNCGTCGNRCRYDHAFGVCTGGQCSQGNCQPGWNDTEPATPGCEYFCIPTGNGIEVCDNNDNDCDNLVDEGFNRQTDVNNCGSCGHTCNLLHASAACVASSCTVVACNPGFVDVNPNVAGCEYQCTASNGGVERCDGVDNDCDGVVDDGNPGGGASCGTNLGVCSAGMTQCSFGVLFCVGQTTGGPEICDSEDDDCDGMVDDGFDKQNDPQHCGGCAPCNLPDAIEGCALGRCTIASCAFGHIDRNGIASDGCEVACINTGAETCDGTDNNCNGAIDETFNTTTDPNNCGTCGRRCGFANASSRCTAGVCALGTCDPSFYDINGQAGDGCEYGCIPSNGGVERCDGVDNDCDGTIDDGNPGGGVGCGVATGECATGTTVCAAGAIDCVNDVGPATESCNNLDDDCNGVADNGFNKLTDPRYCANCAGCNLPHAVAGCAAGSCTVAGCLAGWVNLNGTVADGCEYSCTNSGQEVCDGGDNDCDGLIDQANPSLLVPGNFCKSAGECAGTTPSCTGAAGWDCVYTDPDVEQVGGDVALEETRCDGKDNDCDGAPDEVYPLKNSACGEDGTFATTRKLGVCRGTGALVCDVAMTGLRCNVTAAGATAASETCNNRDDDCDGHVDEPYANGAFTGVTDVTVGPLTVNGQSIVMYRYEASRPDATALVPGFVESRACSVAGRLPWASGDFVEARTACQRAGMRLCRVTRNGSGQVVSDEWGRFCEGPSNRVYPYGNTFSATACNGAEYNPVPGGVNEDVAIATGGLATCQSEALARDQSGNLKEWVEDPRVVGGQTVHTLRGGSYDNFEHGSTCDFDLTVVPTTYTFAHTGFRCCALACPAGQVECSGACVNLATSNTSCGACGQACAGGTACSNGYCCPTGSRACGDVCIANATACP